MLTQNIITATRPHCKGNADRISQKKWGFLHKFTALLSNKRKKQADAAGWPGRKTVGLPPTVARTDAKRFPPGLVVGNGHGGFAAVLPGENREMGFLSFLFFANPPSIAPTRPPGTPSSTASIAVTTKRLLTGILRREWGFEGLVGHRLGRHERPH